jgi:adenosine deaminase CECR1
MEKAFEFPRRFDSVEEYFKSREALICAESKLGYEGRTERNPLEVEVEKVVRRIKLWEERNHYGVQDDGSGHEAGHRFLHARDAIEKSQLYEIARMAPKGALLHCHFDSILPPRNLLDDARKQSRLYIKCDVPLISEGFFASALPLFGTQPEDRDLSETENVFSRNYVAGSWMKYSEFLRLFPGGLERAESWITKRMVLEAVDAYNPSQTVDG